MALLIAGFIGAAALHPSVITWAYAPLCLYAMIGPKQAIKALSLSYIMILLNPAFHELPVVTSMLRWVILLVAGLRVLPAISLRSLRLIVPLLIFSTMTTVLSWWQSPSFEVSFWKIAGFTFCVATVLVAFNALDRFDLDELRTWFLTMTAVVVLLSLPTLAIPKVGFFLNGRGFQGIFLHPQTMGTFLAPTAAYLGACLLLRSCPQTPITWGLWGTVMVLMLLTRSRTALVAFFLSLGVTLVAAFFSSRKAFLRPAPSRALVTVVLVAALLAAGVLASPTVSRAVVGFLLKGEKGDIKQAFYHSRGGGISFFWNRFLEAPITGHGFGIDAAHESLKDTDTFFGIPVRSSTELGFLPAAFLEQVGVLGLVLFSPFLVSLVKTSRRQVDIGLVATFFACLFVNIGEAVFFSPGQIGGYLWLLMGLSTASGWEIQTANRSDGSWTGHEQSSGWNENQCRLRFPPGSEPPLRSI
jgi:hypothetical protein